MNTLNTQHNSTVPSHSTAPLDAQVPFSKPVSQHAAELPIADIHIPNGVSAWPPAIGWWLLALLILLGITGMVMGYKKYRKKWGYRNAALTLLASHKDNHIDNTHAVINILKRTAMTAYPEQNIRSLHGDAWITCLNQQTKERLFTGDIAAFLVLAQYQHTDNMHTVDHPTLYKACQRWIKTHHTHYHTEER
jgi:hypothetical protein